MTGKRSPGTRGTTAQRQARRNFVIEKTLEGYSRDDIAEALSVTASVVATDRKLGRERLRYHVRRTWRSPRPAEPLEKFNWLATPAVAVTGSYVRTTPVRHVRSLYDQLTSMNGLNRLAHNVAAARAAGDTRQLAVWQRQIETLIRYLQDMEGVLSSESARQRAASALAARDDLRAGALDESRNSRPLPPFGSGEVPTFSFARIWRYWYAGLPVDSDAIVTILAREMNITPERARAAAKEWLSKMEGS